MCRSDDCPYIGTTSARFKICAVISGMFMGVKSLKVKRIVSLDTNSGG